MCINLLFCYYYSEITRIAKLRKNIDPMDIHDTEFKNRYRLNKKAFRFLTEQLRQKTSLKSSSRISLELAVITYTYA